MHHALLRCDVMKKQDRAEFSFPTTLVGYFSLQLAVCRVYNRRLISAQYCHASAGQNGGQAISRSTPMSLLHIAASDLAW